MRPIVAAILLALSLAPAASAAEPKKLVITGASTIAPLMAEIAKKFEATHPGTRIDVQSGGSSRGVTDVRQGAADVGMVSRSMNPDEGELKAFTIAMDGVTVILNKANPVQTLTREQIVAIYTGKTRNWKDVGGPDQPIVVVNKAEGRSTLDLFLQHFALKAPDVKASIIIGDNAQGIKTVAGNPQAIGYVSIGSAEYEAGHGAAIKLLSLGGVAPSVESVRAGKFPLARPLNLVTKQEPTGLAKELIDFARSAAVDDLVKEQFFVPLARTAG